ncbi:MAG: DUF3604 domain-containing protein [Gammaproteobacteria bacterium]|nr:DUF3604 domain-containing protein [Gammaproteobacteria bacterium]
MKLTTKLGPVAALAAALAVNGADIPENVYFGDLHLHTRYSNDAFAFGTERTPDDAYRYAKGEAVPHIGGVEIRLNTPLDFLAVTDHAENIGIMQSFQDPNHPYRDNEIVKWANSRDRETRLQSFYAWIGARASGENAEVFDNPGLGRGIWAEIIEAADRHYAPGEFTTFAAYEWTVSVDRGNLHRNVIFKATDQLPFPFSGLDSQNPEDLWDYLDAQRANGIEALAIPHNTNVSDGRMFALVDFAGAPMTAEYAVQRVRNEPVVEITQAKGTSETHPVMSPNDEFADFELFPELLVANGRIGKVPGSYVREAIVNGVRMRDQQGFNPFQFGFVGATDFHSGTSAVEENNMTSMSGDTVDATLEERLVTSTWSRMPFQGRSAAGLTGAWAHENTRDEIYASLRRRETYATTGTRIAVRFFGGWSYSADLLEDEDWVVQGYAGGVPMGGVLRGDHDDAPTFAVWAAKDPAGANLDRVQVIKGWSEAGETFEHIYDVALSDGRRVGPTGKAPPVGNTVDVMKATYTDGIGAASLQAVWQDPDFDAGVHAVYYVRVIEIPTPRWSTYDTAAAGLPPRGDLAPTLQERAYTSPIWYLPEN